MPSFLLEYRLRIRNQANTADALVISSVRGDAAPYLEGPPSGDGGEFDPLTGAFRSGSMTCRVVDAITGGTNRVLTSQLEDANFRQQLTSRAAFVEVRQNGGAWTVDQAGIVTAIRLASDIVYEVDVGDTMRSTRNLVAFAPRRDTVDATKVESLATFLARWPKRGCLAGGPVRGGFLRAGDLNGWEFKVVTSQGSGTSIVKGLSFTAGYLPPEFKRTTNANDFRDVVNQAVGDAGNGASSSTFPLDLPASLWRDLVVELIGIGNFAAGWFGQSITAITPPPTFFAPATVAGAVYVADPGNVLTIGQSVRLRVFDALPSERSPIYYSGHPIDLWTALLDEAGLAYNAAAVTTVKNALGTSRRINLRITSQQDLASFLESVLYGPCGFSARSNAAGELVPFTTRIMASAAPAVTLAAVDVPDGEQQLFDLSEPDAITRVVFTQKNLITAFTDASVKATDGRSAVSTDPRVAVARTTPSMDGVTVQEVRVERTSGDTAAAVQKEQTYDIPGFLDSGGGTYEPALVDAIALEIFDRYGRGRLAGEITALRGGAGDPLLVGDEMILAVPAMPNHNKRLGDDNTVSGRAVQIVRRTPQPNGAHLRFIDSGPNAQPVATLPVVSLAAGPGLGLVLATITNAATLNAAGIGARLQWAQSAGGAPATSAYADVAAFLPGQVPTAAFPLPVASAGNSVYARARSEQPGKRPSNYSVPVFFATAALAAPTGLTATPNAGDGSKCTLAWTPGTSTGGILTDVFVRLTADPASADIRQLTLLPGSIGYTLEGLTPGANFTASVQHREASSGQVSAKTTVAFTAGGTSITLNAPSGAIGFAGSIGADGVAIVDGSYGLLVTAAEYPGFVEVWEALETAVASGTYGAFNALGIPVPSVLNAQTRYVTRAPNDGLRRRLKARHVRAGTTPSAFSGFVTVLPWNPAGISSTSGGELLGKVDLTSLSPTQTGYSVGCDDSAGAGTSVGMLATCQGCTFSDLTTVKAFGLTANVNTAAIVINRPAVNGGQAMVKIDFTATGRVSDQAIIDIPAQGQDAAVPVTLTVLQDGSVNASVNGANNQLSFRWLASTTSMPNDASVASSGNIVNGRTATIASILGVQLALGARFFFKMIPYTGTGASGTAGQSVGVEIDRPNKVLAGKRLSFSGIQLNPQFEGFALDREIGTVQMLGNSGSFRGFNAIALPDGISLTGFECYFGRLNSTTQAQYKLHAVNRSSGSVTTLATLNASTTSLVYEYSSTGISHTVSTATYTYVIEGFMDSAGGSPGLLAVYLADAGIVYTSPSFTNSY